MSVNGTTAYRRFSSIDDGLAALLAELRPEDVAVGGHEGPPVLHGFTPLPKPSPLGAAAVPPADTLGRLSSTASTVAPAAATHLPPIGTHMLLKGGRLEATPVAMPITFVPVAAGHLGEACGTGGIARGAKLRPGGGLPGGVLPLQPSGGSFAIPAYARSLTQLDFIITDDMEEPLAPPGPRRRGSSILSLLRGASGLSTFADLAGISSAELADENRLGELPAEEDLRLGLFVDPLLGVQPHLAGSGGSGAAAAAAAGAWPPQPWAHAHTGLFFQQAAWGSGAAPNASSGQANHRLTSPQGMRHAPHPGSAAAAAAAFEASAAAAAFDTHQQASLASLKRRVDRMDLDGSPRGNKRHSSGGGTWSGSCGSGSDGQADSGGETPRSSTPRTGARDAGGQQGGFHGSGSAPSRLRNDSRRRTRPDRSSSDNDPSYAPVIDRERARPPSKQQQQQQYQTLAQPQSYGAVQRVSTGAGSAGEEAPAQQQYRGVSRHRLTQRWEASLWLNGRQLYLGGFNSQEDAARAYDLAALACKGHDAQINFSPQDYREQLAEIAGYSRDEVVAYVRRRSSAFSRGKSKFRGVSGHNGRWEARIGSFGGRKNVSFGVFDSEEGAARQYDRALILEKGRSAKTNFPTRDYEAEVAAYEAHLLATCGAVHGPAIAEVAAAYTLPTDREATADEKKRSAVIYAEEMRRVLRSGE